MMKEKIIATLILAAMAAGTAWIMVEGFGENYDMPLDETIVEAVAEHSTNAPTLTEEYIAEVMEWERPHVEETIETEAEPRYKLTDEERTEIERVTMAEAGGEPREGIIAVAQCILNAAENSNISPVEAVKKYGYTSIRKEPNEAVREAVKAVFDRGETIIDEPILYFYATYIYSAWHESQEFVIEIGNHRFFKAKGERTK